MEIKATYNGTEYTPVESVTAGGKTALLSASADLENKVVTITENGDTEVFPSADKDGIGSVTIHTAVEGSGEFIGGVKFDAVDADGKPTEITFKNMAKLIGSFLAFNGTYASLMANVKKVHLDNVVTTIPSAFARSHRNLINCDLPNSITTIAVWGFGGCTNLVINSLPSSLVTLGEDAFGLPNATVGISGTINISELPPNLVTIENYAFGGCKGGSISHFPASIDKIGKNAFATYRSGERMTADTIYFDGTPTSIAATAFNDNTWITDIYVPWAEGAVANAPWGATNATVHYNHVG